MPLTGTDSVLQQTLQAAIFAGLQAEFSADIAPSGTWAAQVAAEQQMKLATAIAKIALPLITHIVANTLVNPGQAVVTAGGPSNQAGSTVSPGTVS